MSHPGISWKSKGLLGVHFLVSIEVSSASPVPQLNRDSRLTVGLFNPVNLSSILALL